MITIVYPIILFAYIAGSLAEAIGDETCLESYTFTMGNFLWTIAMIGIVLAVCFWSGQEWEKNKK